MSKYCVDAFQDEAAAKPAANGVLNPPEKNRRLARWNGKLRFDFGRNGRWTKPLARLGQGHLLSAGSKAVTLGQLLRAGLPVPAGFVITTAAFHKFLDSAPGWEALRETLARIGGNGASPVDELSRKCAETLAQAPLPAEVERAVQRSLEKFPEVRFWAVRSSATAEDLPQASFAGQYESFLNVPNDEVLDKVRCCWMSMFSPRALAYRIRNHISPEGAAMAVLLQEMVPAEAAGVMFTAEPVSGDARRLVLEAAHGLGDRVISGHAAPERVVLERWTHKVIERSRNDRIAPGPGRQNRSDPRAPESAGAHAGDVFQNGVAGRLADLGLRVERLLGSPLDIEWAVYSDKIHLLQVRPITGIAHDWESRQIWSNLNVGEAIPDVATPITWSLLQRFLDPLFHSVLALHGAALGEHKLVGLVGGRIYFNVNTALAAVRPFSFLLKRVQKVGRALAGGESELALRILESIPDDALPDLGFRWLKYILSWPRLALALGRHSPRRGDAWTVRLKTEIDQLVGVELESMSTPELLQFFTKLARNGFAHWDLLYLLTQSTALPFFQRACRNWLNDPELTRGYRLFAGLGGVAEAEAGLALWRLAALAHADPQTEAVLTSNAAWPAALVRLQQTQHGRKFVDAWNAFMREHGHHCRGELEVYNPRWSESLDYILGVVRGYLGSVDRMDLEENQRRLAQERSELTQECRRRLRNPLKRWVFTRALRRAQRVAQNREEWKNQAVRQLTVLRRALLELGRRLQQDGVFAQSDDVFFLDAAEIEALAAGSRAGLREKIASRRQEYVSNLGLNPPPVVVGRFCPNSSPAAKPLDGVNVLEGIAVSPGKVIGRAKVILRTNDHEQVLPGEILVAPFTDPAWTPYFVTAAGVVSDQGGILSHGSIVAREYGLPAVTNVACATQVIRTGMLVEVDGDLGRVTILEAHTDTATDTQHGKPAR